MKKNIALVLGSGRETKILVNGALVAPRDIKEMIISVAFCSSEKNVELLAKYGVHAVHIDPLAPVRVREANVYEGEDGVNPHFFLKDDEGVEFHLGDDLAIIDALLEWCRHYRVPLDIRLRGLVDDVRRRLVDLRREGRLTRFVAVHKVAARRD